MQDKLKLALPDEGFSGPLWTVEFADFVWRNAYDPGRLRFIYSKWGDKYHNRAPEGTCSLVNGSMDEGLIYNVPHPQIPELTVIDPDTNRIAHRGWRGLVQLLLNDRVLKPTREVERLVGHKLFDQLRKGVATGCV